MGITAAYAPLGSRVGALLTAFGLAVVQAWAAYLFLRLHNWPRRNCHALHFKVRQARRLNRKKGHHHHRASAGTSSISLRRNHLRDSRPVAT